MLISKEIADTYKVALVLAFCATVILQTPFVAIFGGLILFNLWKKKEHGVKITVVVFRDKDKKLDNYIRVVKKEVSPKLYNLLGEVENRNNRSILISGLAGTGKTFLLEWLIWQHTDPQEFVKYGNVEEKPRVIVFSPKTIPHGSTPDFAWLPRVNISNKIPNPFLDYQALESALTVCFIAEIRSKGVVAVSLKPLLAEIMKAEPKSWSDIYDTVKRLKKNNTDEMALQTIENIVRAVERPISNESVNFDSDVVLDYGNFGNNKILKSFYMELYAHAIFAQQYKENAKPTLIVLDEAHYLLRYAEQGSIIGTIMREGRIGVRAVYLATQHLTDIADDLRQVGAELMFHTGNPSDFDAVRVVNPFMADALRLLSSKHEFIDLKQQSEKDEVVYVFKLEDANFEKFRNIPFVRIEEKTEQEVKPEADNMPLALSVVVDLGRQILEMMQTSEFALTKSDIAKKCSIPDDHKVLHALRKLQNTDAVRQTKIRLRKKEVNYYYIPKTEQCHNLELVKTREKIVNSGWNVVFENKHGIQGADFVIERNGIQIKVEVETGHRDSLGRLEERIVEYDKPTLIVLPCQEQKERYSYLPCVQSGKAKLVLIPEIEEVLKNWK
ncbi:MAG: hypothetical protein WA799_00905 [Nitrosotalea sp.]